MSVNGLINKGLKGVIFVTTFFSFIKFSSAQELPKLKQSYRQSTAYTQGNQLVVSTGLVERRWTWTGKGLATSLVKSAKGELVAAATNLAADWNIGELGEGRIVAIKAFQNSDEGFTSEHLAVEVEVKYAALFVKYVIWVYPNTTGFRTQLWLKSSEGTRRGEVSLHPGISEILNLRAAPSNVRGFGYYGGLKANIVPYDILTTVDIAREGSSDIVSGLIVNGEDRGIILLKESQKHTHMNRQLETGGFVRKGNLLEVNGLGIRADDISTDYKFCWANWMILYDGGDTDAQLALKRFDRARYPVHPGRDIFIMANTWGSEDGFDQSAYKAREENVLREIEACTDLGIDLLQIDDGWQIRSGKDSWLPAQKGPTTGTYRRSGSLVLHDGTGLPESYAVYPEGFANVKKKARKAGIELGLWHAWTAPLPALQTNFDNGKFKAFKLDFALLDKKSSLDSLYYKARDLIKYSGYKAVVNWDVTERAARMGFYFGRDCGNLYLANRKAYTVREDVQYHPWQVLRDAWELADYMNLNKVQITFQNKDLTPDTTKSDALKYPHRYNLAITLMASPIFFTETQYLSESARAALKPLIAQYKAERDEMYKGYVFALGQKPDNKSWTGFQNHNPDTGDGYITVFRELNNERQDASIALHFFKPGSALELTDIVTRESRRVILNERSEITFDIPEAPGFLFLKYRGFKDAD